MTDHPDFSLYERAAARRRNYVKVDICPGCGKSLRKFGRFITVIDEDAPVIVLSSICWRCSHRLESQGQQGEKILEAIRDNIRLLANSGGRA